MATGQREENIPRSHQHVLMTVGTIFTDCNLNYATRNKKKDEFCLNYVIS